MRHKLLTGAIVLALIAAAGVAASPHAFWAIIAPEMAAAPPTGTEAVSAAVAAPLNVPRSNTTSNVGHATRAVLPELTGARAGLDYVTQLASMRNDPGNSVRICVQDYLYDAGNVTCPSFCAKLDAGTLTCNGAGTTDGGSSNDGVWVDPGETLPLRDTAKLCFCEEAALTTVDAGTIRYQASRAARP